MTNGNTIKDHRRTAFAKVKQGVIGLAYVRTSFMALQQAEGRNLEDHLQMLGSAFVVDDAGIAATAYHVVSDHFEKLAQAKQHGTEPPPELHYVAHPVLVETGDQVATQVVTVSKVADGGDGSDRYDLALIRLHPVKGRFPPALTLSTSLYEEGDELAICGWPYGLGLHSSRHHGSVLTASFSPAMVSAVLPFPGAPMNFREIIQLSAIVNGGNSGGPVFDPETGDVLGVVIEAVEDVAIFRATGPVYDVGGNVIAWKEKRVRIDTPAGMANATPIHLLTSQLQEFKKRAGRQAHARAVDSVDRLTSGTLHVAIDKGTRG